jgi:8-amino-7-oxononanoate synthase
MFVECALIPGRASRILASRRRDCQSDRKEIPLRNPAVNIGSHTRRDVSAASRDAELGDELDALRAAGLFRFMRRVDDLQAPRMRVDGRPVLMLAGANYLDLAGDPRVTAAAAEASARHGAAAGGSRLISGNTILHEALEAELADFLGTESALLFSTGYMANLGVITALAGPEDVIVSDALNHASTIDACRLARADTVLFRHNDPADLERVCADLQGYRRRLLVLDGVYSMEGDVARLRDLVPIARRHDLWTVVDDAHGVGVLGAHGRGSAEQEGVAVDVQIGNLGKALGSLGAFVACSARLRELLINTARSFIFTCALAPGNVGAARAALVILRAEPERRERLLERAARLRTGIGCAGYDTGRSATQIVPAIIGDNAEVMRTCESALERGVYAQGIRYPSVPRGSERIRFTPTAGHTTEDVERVVEVFASLRARTQT